VLHGGHLTRIAEAPVSHPPSPPSRPLIITADARLLDDLLRCAAAAGVDPEVHADPGAARYSWNRAPIVFLGRDVASRAEGLALPRRRDVVLVVAEAHRGEVWEAALKAGCEDVIFLPDGEGRLVERLADTAERLDRPAASVCVMGGRGGAGATTLAVALALTAARRGSRVVLVDGDPLGGGIDLTLGGEDSRGLRWPDLADTRGRVSGSTLIEALPRVDRLTVLSWDRGIALSITPEAMDSVLAAARRSSDLVVVDLPRHPHPASEVALAAADVTLLLVPAEVRATAAAGRVAALVGSLTADLRVVVRGPAPSDLPASVVAEALGLPLAGSLRAEPGLSKALEHGQAPGRRGRGPLAQFCGEFLHDLTSLSRRERPAA
jgi:secretion/DNA translocation related CpaE-like protein